MTPNPQNEIKTKQWDENSRIREKQQNDSKIVEQDQNKQCNKKWNETWTIESKPYSKAIQNNRMKSKQNNLKPIE